MKKIAFYVEGQTEQFFINKLLIEIAGQKNIQIELQQFQGVGKPTKSIYPKTTAQPQNPQHFALIFDCKGDGGVKPRILQDSLSASVRKIFTVHRPIFIILKHAYYKNEF